MTCEHDSIFDRLADLIGGQAEQTHRVHAAVSELHELMRRPANVRTVASDRVKFLAVYVRDDRVVELIPATIDRARVTIMPVAGTIYLGDGENVTTDGLERCQLATGIGLTLDTRGRITAIAAAGAAVTVYLAVEQWDGPL